jgi:hypothetical protein
MRSAFSNPPACIAPASMPESLAATMQRMPADKPDAADHAAAGHGLGLVGRVQP